MLSRRPRQGTASGDHHRSPVRVRSSAVPSRPTHRSNVAVVDADGRLNGFVTFDDLLRLLGREFMNLIEGIEPEMEVR